MKEREEEREREKRDCSVHIQCCITDIEIALLQCFISAHMHISNMQENKRFREMKGMGYSILNKIQSQNKLNMAQ